MKNLKQVFKAISQSKQAKKPMPFPGSEPLRWRLKVTEVGEGDSDDKLIALYLGKPSPEKFKKMQKLLKVNDLRRFTFHEFDRGTLISYEFHTRFAMLDRMQRDKFVWYYRPFGPTWLTTWSRIEFDKVELKFQEKTHRIFIPKDYKPGDANWLNWLKTNQAEGLI